MEQRKYEHIKISLHLFTLLAAITVSTQWQLQTVDAGYHAMSCDTRRSLEGEGAHTIQSVASISKVMTAIVAIENSSMEDFIQIGNHIPYAEGSSIYLQAGQLVSMRSLLYGLLLRSGNDAAMAIAEYIGGNEVDRFVLLMNEKAQSLGLMNTVFTNPSGLDEDGIGNQSTPYDMSLLMCASLAYPQLREIMTTRMYTTEYHHVWSNKNRLLSIYPYTIGGKTGFTKQAGRTLISGADKEYPIAIATFRIGNDFNFHKTLYEKLYEQYTSYTLVKKGIYIFDQYRFQVEQNLNVIVEAFNPKAVHVTYDNKTHELVIEYVDGNYHQTYRVKGRRL